jgi:glycosyltransferase involved in cell wall biosynthesis
MVPIYIAAADLCLAPYRASAFHNGEVSFSTLKIPEYMACGRPVISVPSGHIRKLIRDQISGFLFSNSVPSWISFFKGLPSRQQLEEMGRAAHRAVESQSWEKTAAQYLEVCYKVLKLPKPVTGMDLKTHQGTPELPKESSALGEEIN